MSILDPCLCYPNKTTSIADSVRADELIARYSTANDIDEAICAMGDKINSLKDAMSALHMLSYHAQCVDLDRENEEAWSDLISAAKQADEILNREYKKAKSVEEFTQK